MFENEFKGKVVLVTGGSRGIGFAAVKGFLAGGAKVYFLSHYEETGAKALAALKEINPDYEVMTPATEAVLTMQPLVLVRCGIAYFIMV